MALTAVGVQTLPVGTRLNPIVDITNQRIMRVRKQSILPRIAVIKPAASCGESMRIRHEYAGSVGGTQWLSDGGKLKPVNLTIPKEVVFTVGDRLGWAVRVDSCVYEKIMKYDKALISEVVEYHNQETLQAFDQRAIYRIMAEASRHNVGKKAGFATHIYDLGTEVAPIEITQKRVWAQVKLPKHVLDEQQIGFGSKPYVLYFGGLMDYVSNNDRLAAYYMNGKCHVCVEGGTWYDMRDVDGIDYIRHSCLPFKTNAQSEVISPFIFGVREALWASLKMSMNKKMGVVGDDAHYLETYWDFGLRLIEPRMVGVGWMRIPLYTGDQ